MVKKERKIKNDKPIYRLVLNKGVYCLVNMDNYLIFASSSISDLACTCALCSNMPWQFDTLDLKYFDKKVENEFWNAYNAECERLTERYIKLYHNN